MGFKFYMPWDDVPEEKQAEIAAARSQGPLGFDITGPQSVFSGAFDPTTQTTSSDPWGPQQPYLQNMFGEANRLYNQGYQTPDMSGMTNQYMSGLMTQFPQSQQNIGGAQNVVSNIAGGGLSPMSGMAGQYLTGAARGDYLGSNPFLDKMYGRGAEQLTSAYSDVTMPGINQAFGGSAGAFGSGAHQALTGQAQEQLGGSLGNLATDIYGGAYESERGRQQQAAGLLGNLGISDINTRLSATGQVPGLDTQSYYGLGQIGQAGQYSDLYAQQRNMDPWTNLGLYRENIGGNYGGTQTGPGPSQFDTWLNRLSQGANVAAPFVLGGNQPPQQQVYGDAYLPGNPYA